MKTKITLALALLLVLGLTGQRVLAQQPELHPTFPLLDDQGQNVLDSGRPVSTMTTCGGCHDTAYIASHSYHADMGLNDLLPAGAVASGHPWDTGAGLYGGWSPLLYRYLTPAGDTRFDMGVADWVRVFGFLHVGGGPAEAAPDGTPLAQVAVSDDPADPVTHILDPETGRPVPWDWSASGTIEMNCFLCHLPAPNNQARLEAIQAGRFEWANTATLLGTGILTDTNGSLTWVESAFTAEGELEREFVTVQDPSDANCGQCHGEVHTLNAIPLVYTRCDWNTARTGEIFSAQRLFKTGMNLQDKQDLTRAWDVHAERAVECVDCHPSVNNPVYFRGSRDDQLSHLLFDARRLDVVNYLYQPSHEFAKGSSQSALAPDLDNTMRLCTDCHDPDQAHDWLPYRQSHFDALTCEACHIPQMYAPALQQVDWTAIKLEGELNKVCRGAEGEPASIETVVTGYAPVLLPEKRADGGTVLSPYNLISTWYWQEGDPPRPVRMQDLRAVYVDGDDYSADVLAALDSNGDGALIGEELRLDTPAKVELIRQKLLVLGLDDPRIVAQIQPYRINHDVASGEWATRDCETCHSEDSRLVAPYTLATYTPGGVMPGWYGTEGLEITGRVESTPDGYIVYQPDTGRDGLYVFGHSSVYWVDWFGIIALLGTTLGVVMHGGLRLHGARKFGSPHHTYRRVYMYTFYERVWHWVQTVAILILIFTGLVIHKPDQFGIFSFPYVVYVHNTVAFVLLADALLALFYHLASGEIKQFIPHPRGLFDQMIVQTRFYLQGIFKGEAHPFEKVREKKLNPLQQLTYVGLLNVLLPLQVITGVLMWGAQHWLWLAGLLGGLPILAPIHSLIAWLLATFIVLHVYLTTTGHSILGGIQAMVDGWEMVEVKKQPDQEPQTAAVTPQENSL